MGKRVRYDFELVDGSYVETDKGAAFRISETFGFTNEKNIKILAPRSWESSTGPSTTSPRP